MNGWSAKDERLLRRAGFASFIGEGELHLSLIGKNDSGQNWFTAQLETFGGPPVTNADFNWPKITERWIEEARQEHARANRNYSRYRSMCRALVWAMLAVIGIGVVALWGWFR